MGKNKFFVLSIAIGILGISNKLCAQDHKHETLEHQIMELERTAYEYFNNYKFNFALESYLKLDSLNPGQIKYSYPIGACYIQAEDTRGLKYLEKCLEMKDRFPKQLIKYLATGYHLDHQFARAEEFYQEYIGTFKNKKGKVKKKDKKYIEEMEIEIAYCENGKKLMETPLDVKIEKLAGKVNSEYPEYAPVLNADETVLIFTSERPNTTGGHRNMVDGFYSEDLYISKKGDDGLWSEPVNMGDSVNTKGEDASVSLSPDGHYLLVYRWYKHDLLHNSGDLFLSELIGDVWTSPVRLPDIVNSPKNWEPSGSLSSDGNLLVFTSDREGSVGGTDIFISQKNAQGEWTEPKSIGKNINTKYDEDSPWLHPDGKTLYFASKGHNTMGGFDIFFSKWDEEKKEWAAPQNLGYPINTAHDDIHFSWSLDGKRLYFSALRPEGEGEKDIFVATFNEPVVSKITIKNGTVVDKGNQKPLKAVIKVVESLSKNELGIFKSNSVSGNFTVVLDPSKEYDVTVSCEGYKDYTYKVKSSEKVGFSKIMKKIELEK